MKKNTLAMLVAIAIVLAIGVSWEVYRWNECRSVGHGIFYCIVTAGGR